MALKKSELYSSLWQSCDELRGGMDASQYKDYVLVLLFVKYVSDRYAGKPYAAITVPTGASFADMAALKGRPDIGDQINKKILAPLAQANNLADMPDFNDDTKLGTGKAKQERLTNLVAIFENPALDFSRNGADGDDLLGDAYEYLMRHFATQSGKSKGQFYTPAEVSRVIAQILGIRHASPTAKTTVCDPTCGSGSLLLKVADEAAQGTDLRVSLYGQDKDSSTANLARMNVILHDYATAEINQGDTLTDPRFIEGGALKTFDYAVANPPFSDKRWSTGLDPENDAHGRFKPYGVPPAKQGDYGYLLHLLRSMKPSGRGAIILPHGVLFRGNAEAAIRRKLIQHGYIKGIIGLPPNLFFGTGIPACIIVLEKGDAAARQGIFMIDASKGFRKDGAKNRLRAQDIHKIVDIFTRQVELPRYSRLVPVTEIADARNDYNLNLPRYIDTSEPEDIQDIGGHLRGGIPERDIDALARYWDVFPGVRAALFEPDRPGYLRLRVPVADIKTTIFGHPEFTALTQTVTRLFEQWRDAAMPMLKGFAQGDKPKALIERLAESLLEAFRPAPLLDAYDIYQHLMDYVAETMQDDAYVIAEDGWVLGAQPRMIVEAGGKDAKARVDFTVGKLKYETQLVPSTLLIARYFARERDIIDNLEAAMAVVEKQMEDMVEEQGGEGGLLADAMTDSDTLTKPSIKARLKEIANDRDAADERKALQEYLALIERETEAKATLKGEREAMMEKVLGKFGELTKTEIIELVIDKKWLVALWAALRPELERASQALSGRISQLADRYGEPLPLLINRIEVLRTRVDLHLAKIEQLLTGQTRLPGFKGEWSVGPLKAGIELLSGQHVLAENCNELGIGVPYITGPSDFPQGIIRHSKFTERPSTICSTGDILITVKGSGAGSMVMSNGRYCISRQLMAIRVLSWDVGYIYRSLLNNKSLIGAAATGLIPGLSRSDLLNLALPLPSKAEQTAIAAVLSDIDSELDALEQRRSKTEMLKQGMMQELLTGRTRLV